MWRDTLTLATRRELIASKPERGVSHARYPAHVAGVNLTSPRAHIELCQREIAEPQRCWLLRQRKERIGDYAKDNCSETR